MYYNFLNKAFIFTVLSLGLFFLAACGGGGGGTTSTNNKITPPDGYSYVYATNQNYKLAFNADYSGWSTNSKLDGKFSGDSDYNPVFKVAYGDTDKWGTVLAITGKGKPFAAGFASKFEYLHFKIKGVDSINVKFVGGTEVEKTYDLSKDTANVKVIAGKTGWKQVKIPLTDFSGIITNNAFAIFFIKKATFYVTDIAFSGTATTPGTGGGGTDKSSDVLTYIYATDKSTKLSYRADKDFKYNVWGTGTVLSRDYASDPGYNPVFKVNAGTGWGTVLAMLEFKAGFASKFKNLHFKIKGVEKIKVKFADAATNATNDKEFEYDLSTNTTYATDIAGKTGWKQVKIPLGGFTGRATNKQFAIFYPGKKTFYITDIAFSPATDRMASLGSDINGHFETGNFDGWTNFANGGTIDITGDTHGGGKWVAHIKAPPGKNPTIKQEGILKKIVKAGDNIRIMFDIKGSLANGGIVNAQMFSEGTPVITHNLETINALTNTWVSKTYSRQAGTDVERGITFQISVVCGATTNCVADVYVDNVTVSIEK